MIARELQVVMRLLYPGPAAAAAGMPAPLARLVDEAGERLGMRFAPEEVAADPLKGCLAAARGGLLVVASGGNPLRERILGIPAERLIRLAPAPVLVVKRTAVDRYGRVLVPVDLHPGSELLLQAAAVLAPAAATAVFHSLPHASPEGAVSGGRARDVRARQARRACEDMMAMRLSGRVAPHRPPADCAAQVPVVAFGAAAETILAAETAHRPDLIVVGRSCGRHLADFLLGGVAQQVLARSEADVLVVPAMNRGCRRASPGRLTRAR